MSDELTQTMKRYYHGGNGGLLVGTYILPPAETGTKSMADFNSLLRKDRVYITTDIAGAMFFASAADYPIVYEVTPEGNMEDDPDHKTQGISFACPKAKIIAFHKVPDEVIQQNRLRMIAAPPVAKP
jgi:hypothetical protein